MRIIDYFNILAIITYVVVVFLLIIKKPSFLHTSSVGNGNPSVKNNSGKLLSGEYFSGEYFSGEYFSLKWEAIFFVLLLGLGIFLRFYRLATLPEGMHQDEVSNAYEAFCLANYGIDRNGYKYPVYPITWGSGGGSPVLIYLYSLICQFTEPSVLTYRSIFASFGCITLVLFYFFIRKAHGTKAALLSMGAMALMPWHIVLSRWGLDSNTIPFWCMVVLFLFLYANKTQKTWLYILTAVFCAITLYCYGSATFVIPVFLLLACGYSLWTGRLNIRQLVFSGMGFLITVLPLAVFYFINVFDLPAIITPYFSIPKFTGNHTGSVFITLDSSLPVTLFNNLIHLFQMLTVGCEDELWNYVPGYFTLYHFTFPVTFLGIYTGFKSVLSDIKEKKYNNNALMSCMLLAAVLFSFILNQNINRMVFIFLPLIYFFGLGVYTTGKYSRYLLGIVIVIFGLGSVSFTHDYFVEYGPMSSYLFMKGYGDAIAYAESINEDDNIIYSTYDNLASPFITALLYTRTSPHDYGETSVFKDEEAEFRVAVSFAHFVFGLPEDIEDEKYYDNIIIISNGEQQRFAHLPYSMTEFGNYTVLEYNGN